jgi:adenylate cyclase
MQNGDDISVWLARAGLDSVQELDLLNGFVERCNGLGLRLTRAAMLMDTLHPTWEGRAYRWRKNEVMPDAIVEYGPSDTGENAESWRRSVFFALLQDGSEEFHADLQKDDLSRFPLLEELKAEGNTGYLAFVHRFAPEGTMGEMDCFYSAWTTNAPGGFAEGARTKLRQLVPMLGLATKATALTRIVGTVAEVYLGRDAGKRMLAGQITRGVSERIATVLWFSDLRGFTTITDTAEPEQIIPLLNDYAEAVIAAVHEQGGDVLKLIGDGILAVFGAGSPDQAASAALRAEAALRSSLIDVDARRAAAGGQSRPAYRRGVLRQYRLQRAARLYGGRTSGQRGQPHRDAVPLGRSQRADVLGIRCRHARRRAWPHRFGRPLCAARRSQGARTFYAGSRRGLGGHD